MEAFLFVFSVRRRSTSDSLAGICSLRCIIMDHNVFNCRKLEVGLIVEASDELLNVDLNVCVRLPPLVTTVSFQ